MSFRIIECDGIDGEVATGEVFKKGSAEFNFVRSASIRICGFGTVRRYLDYGRPFISAACFYTDGAVVIFIKRVRKYTLNLFRCRVCGDVPILRFSADEQVADTPADKICFIACAPQVFPDS